MDLHHQTEKSNFTVVLILWMLLPILANSQEISGVVIDEKTQEPLPGASVYFNNTTLGTTADMDGFFTIEYPEGLKTPLVISFVGYRPYYIEGIQPGDQLTIQLHEAENLLKEVVLTSDESWPRAIKLEEFKKHYFGSSKAGRSCEILNEEVLILWYNEETKTLKASTNQPLLVRNQELKYHIAIDLNSFEAQYSYVSKNLKRRNVYGVTYVGSNHFSNSESLSPVDEQRRIDTYYGSTLHFMRSLASNSLNENGFEIFMEGGRRSYKQEIETFPAYEEGAVTVNLQKKYQILYKGKKRSTIDCYDDTFYIDGFGNHSPPDRVVFTGDLGGQRMGDTLPLDFQVPKAEEDVDQTN